MWKLGKKSLSVFIITAFLIVLVHSFAKAAQELELGNPGVAVKVLTMKLAPRITTLERKTVVLRWNGRPNGNVFLNRVAELLTSQVKDVNVIKAYEMEPETSTVSHTIERGKEIAKMLVAMNPDIVIASQGD